MLHNSLRFGLLMLQILIFSFIYMFLNDSHFSGINTLEEMIREEVLQRKIDPIIEETETKEDVYEMFENQSDKIINSKKEIKMTAEKVKTDIETGEIDDLIKPTIFDKFFKRLYFSFVTGTTLGYGDIFPNSMICKFVTIMQLISTILLLIV